MGKFEAVVTHGSFPDDVVTGNLKASKTVVIDIMFKDQSAVPLVHDLHTTRLGERIDDRSEFAIAGLSAGPGKEEAYLGGGNTGMVFFT